MQVTVAVTNHRLRHHLLHFLRDDADIGTIAVIIAEAIIAKTIGEMTKQDDVVLDRDVRSPSAATAAAATTTAEAATATEAAGSYPASAETSTADARATACRNNVPSSRPHVS